MTNKGNARAKTHYLNFELVAALAFNGNSNRSIAPDETYTVVGAVVAIVRF